MEQGKQIIIWTGNSNLPTLKFLGCVLINEEGPELRFTYDGISTGKTSQARFMKNTILGYSIEVKDV